MSERINGRYTLHQKLGQGGMGIVHRATDRLTGETVALKQVFLPVEQILFASRPISQSNRELRLALAHEFQTLAGLRHPNIISVLDYGFDEEQQPFFTMSYLEGAKTIVAAANGRSVPEKITLLLQTLEALAYLHRRGILHRDLKPDNVLVVGDTVRVLDFGLAAAKEQATESVGSWLYMAPEVLLGQPASEASDLYTVGVLVYRLLAGTHPFDIYAEDTIGEILEGEPDWGKMGVGGELTAVVRTLLAKQPTDRYTSAKQVIAALYHALGQTVPGETAVIRESYLQAAKFVGRKAEMAQLTGLLYQKETSVWLVGGESGVGKTRLLDELRSRALVDGWRVLTGQAVADGGLPYQLWQEIVPHMVLTSELNDLEAGVLRQIVPTLDTFLSREIPEPPPLQGTAVQQRLVLTLVSILQRQTQPTLLLLEDIHWARESLAPLQQILKVLHKIPQLLVIATYRNDEQPHLSKKLPGANQLQLGRLNKAEVAELSQAMLGKDGSKPEVVSLLTKETEGNTLFIVEAIRMLAEEAGQLDKIALLALPSHILTRGMQHLLERRIVHIPVADFPLLQLTAVAGRQLDELLLAHLSNEADLDAWLHRLSEATMIVTREKRWSFAHEKLREIILDSMSAEEQCQSHHLVAEAIEQCYPNNKNYYESLLEHWHLAGNIDREMQYIMPVAENLVEIQADFSRARDFLTRSLQALPEADPRRVPVYNWQGLSYLNQGKYDDAQIWLQRSLTLAQTLADQRGLATALQNIGRLLNRQGNFTLARQYLAQSFTIWQEMDWEQGMAVCLNGLGQTAWRQGEFEQAEYYYKQSLEIYQQTGDQLGVANSYNDLGLVVDEYGDFERASSYHQQSLTIRQGLGDQLGMAKSLGNLGIVARHFGDFEQASTYLQQCYDAFQAMGDQFSSGIALYNLGYVAYQQEDYRGAELYYEQSLAITRAIGEKYGIAYALVKLGLIYLESQPQKAWTIFKEALSLAFDIQAKPIMMETLFGLARYAYLVGDIERSWQIVALLQHQESLPHDIQQPFSKFVLQLQDFVKSRVSDHDLALGIRWNINQLIEHLLEEANASSIQDSK